MTHLPFLAHKLIRIARRLAAPLLLAACALSPLNAAIGQQTSPFPLPARIQAEISSARKVQLPGSLHPLAQSRFDAGRVDGQVRLQGISMVFARSANQQADLHSLTSALQSPSSPLYHKWLTPDEFGQRFGMAQADLDKVSRWLEQQGFSIDRTSRSRDRIFFTGTVHQVEEAFSTELHYYNVGGKKQFAPNSALSVPEALSGIVINIGNLDTFKPHPMHTIVKTPAPKADFTSGTTGNNFTGPGDIATIYDVHASWNAGYTGSGQSIAIIGQSYIDITDVEHFQTASGWSTPKDPVMVLEPGSGGDGNFVQGDETESDLDLEWASTMAPGATVFFVYTGNDQNYGVFDALQYAIEDRIAPIVSLSYGACEIDAVSDAVVSSIEALGQQAVTQGQTLLAASGDDGASTCYRDTNLSLSDRAALSVSYPASSPSFTAVGGTQFNEGAGTYWNKQSGTDVISSALSYIPELTWNEDNSEQLGASGGGVSTIFTKPDWQTGVPGIPADGQRDLPDIALDSAGTRDPLLLCSSDQFTWSQGQQSSCTNGFRDSATGVLTIGGGTSFATPIFAGMLAIINQKENSTGQASINPTLYALASNASTYASAFHDITGGDNKCNVSDPTLCPNGATGYSAGTGYDLTTGIGSPDLANLMAAWGTSSLTPTSITVTSSGTSPQIGVPVTFSIAVAPGSGTTKPAGSVTVLVDGTAISPDLSLSGGSATFSQAFSGTGSHIVVATYSGDGTFAPSTTTLSLTVPVSTTTTIVPSPSNPLAGDTVAFLIYVQDTVGQSTNITGTVSILIDGTTVATNIPVTSSTPAPYSSTFSELGKHVVQAVYAGSTGYATSTGVTTVDVIPVQASTTTAIKATTTAPAVGSSDTFTITVVPTSGKGTPDGTLAVYVDGSAQSKLTLTGGSATFSQTFNVAGIHLIQASYSGATAFTASTATLKVNAVAAAPPAPAAATTTSVSAGISSTTIGASDTFTITVAPTSKPASGTAAPAGTVSISVDGTVTASAPSLLNGVATFTTTFTAAGSHKLSATYNGDSSFTASTGSATVTVQPGNFSLSATSITVQRGNAGASTITLTPASGYTGTVALTVTPPASGLTGVCFSPIPDAVVTGAGVVMETLTIDTSQKPCTSTSSAAMRTGTGSGNGVPAPRSRIPQGTAVAMASLVAIGLLGRRSRKLKMLPVVLLLVAFGVVASGCGGGNNSGSSGNNNPPSTSTPAPTTVTLTIIGTDTVTSTITSKTNLSLTLE